MAYAAQNKKALHPVILDLRACSGLADYFLILAGRTDTHVRALVMEMERVCKEHRITIAHVEGAGSWNWVLLDLHDVIVHVFMPRERAYYNLEKIWQQGKHVDLPKL
ncbi:ribosome silencing factor [candidate division FCPU426 bacterium]|nr:ribosome silencing factor [candidate division FCPU426 bacterium]